MKKARNFAIHELVCKDVYNRDGENAWRYFRPVLIDFLDWIREKSGRPVYVNNWFWGGPRSQRGLRCNLCPLVSGKKVLYVSGHMLACGADFNVQGWSANYTRMWILRNIDDFFDKHPEHTPKCRMESAEFAPTWCHIDFYSHNEPGVIQMVAPIP